MCRRNTHTIPAYKLLAKKNKKKNKHKAEHEQLTVICNLALRIKLPGGFTESMYLQHGAILKDVALVADNAVFVQCQHPLPGIPNYLRAKTGHFKKHSFFMHAHLAAT